MACQRAVFLAGITLLAAGGRLPGQAAKDVNLPQSPAAPGFALLGVSPMAVERPGSVRELQASLLTATGNLSLLPKDYAVSVAPYWLVAGGDLTYRAYRGPGTIPETFLQSLSLSIATSLRESGDSSTSGVGLGARFSLLRGTIDESHQNYGARLDSLYTDLRSLADSVNRMSAATFSNDPVITARRDSARSHPALRGVLEQRIGARLDSLQTQLMARFAEAPEAIERVRRLSSSLEVNRVGAKLDVAGGAALTFPGNDFDDGRVSKWGAWVTGGLERRDYGVLGVFRVLGSPLDDDTTTVDLGARMLVNNSGSFGFSGEFVWRQLRFGTDQAADRFRVALNADIRLSPGRAFTVTFGRDFEGEQTGNLIAIIEFALSLAKPANLVRLASP
jgi:hypothetical protein